MFAAHNIRRPVKAAIAWAIISEMARRHGQHSDLRLIEMHPGGGQYDLLRLMKVKGADGLIYEDEVTVLADFNLGSGEFSSPAMEASRRFPWLESWLAFRDPNDAIDEMLPEIGLGVVSNWPSTNRIIFGFRLVAAILASQMTSRYFLSARNGFADTSGEGGGISTALNHFPKVYQRDLSNASFDMDSAAKCWCLYQGLEEILVGCVRMDGVLSSIEDPDRAHDLFPIYSKTRKMSAVTSVALEILGIR